MTTPTPLTPQTMERLAFTRLLHLEGVEQSQRPAPLNKICVLTLHDAVEHFLILACEHAGADQPREFMKYWQEMAKVNTPLTGKVGMDRLNRCRRDFKHAGAPPSDEDIEYARNDAASFFEENTLRVFGVSYDELDMADLVTHSDTKGILKEATTTWASGDRVEGMALLVDAFESLYKDSPMSPRSRSPFAFGEDIRLALGRDQIAAVLRQAEDAARQAGVRRPARSVPTGGAERLASQLHAVTTAVDQMQNALRVMSIGIDYREHHRFDQLTPRVYITFDQKRHVDTLPGYAPTDKDFAFCKRYVIMVALRLAELEA